jgi:hypothetical protein
MNFIAALPIATSLPVASPSSATALPLRTDEELVQAAYDLQSADRTIRDLYESYGDDMDECDDFLAIEDRRDDVIATLITVPSKSMTGVQAKAVCVQLKTLIEDDRHREVAVSLANDILQLGPQAGGQAMLARAADDEQT